MKILFHYTDPTLCPAVQNYKFHDPWVFQRNFSQWNYTQAKQENDRCLWGSMWVEWRYVSNSGNKLGCFGQPISGQLNSTLLCIFGIWCFNVLISSENNSHSVDSPNYRDKYKTLKRKLKFLLYVSHMALKAKNEILYYFCCSLMVEPLKIFLDLQYF